MRIGSLLRSIRWEKNDRLDGKMNEKSDANWLLETLDRVSGERRPKEGESVRRDYSGGKALDIWSRYGGAGSRRGLEVGRPEDTNLG